MIQRIVCILIVVLLQMAATSCSATKQSAHTVCPEPTMTLSDDNADRHCDSAPSASDLMTHQKAGLTLPATETFAAQSRTQARTNHWQWQRSLRCDARMRILAGNRRHAVSSDVLSQTFGIEPNFPRCVKQHLRCVGILSVSASPQNIFIKHRDWRYLTGGHTVD